MAAGGEDVLREAGGAGVEEEYLMSAAEFILNICTGKKWIPSRRGGRLHPPGDLMGPEDELEIRALCDRCMGCRGDGDDNTLYQLAHMDDRTISNLMNESRYSMRNLHEKAWNYATKRMEEARGTGGEERKSCGT